ncbi:MAG: tRNA lysidine(34) synthetase TilS, partial [Anaerolineales bacterium]
LRVDYGWLWIERQGARPTAADWPALDAPVTLAIPGDAALADGWRVAARLLARAALPADWAQAAQPRLAYLDAARLGASALLRARQRGDWLVPLGMIGRQKVSDLLINARAPAACRERLPLLTVQGQVAWVLGVRSDQRYAVTEHTEQVCALRVWREGEGDHD